MLKVFLVEDEIIMREGIKNNINWEAEGFEFAGEASDGELAYPLIRQTRPDILITDIRMPFMDGLELSRLVKMEFPEMSIVILSGYNEFDYAKEALQIGITDYLLKPITSAQLLEELHKIEKKILAKREAEQTKKKQSDSLQQNLLAKQSFFRKLVSGSASMSKLMAEGRNLGVELNAACYNIVQIQFAGDDAEKAERIGQFREIYRRIHDHRPDLFIVVQGQEEFSCLIKGTDEEDVRDTEQELTEKVRQFIMEVPSRRYFGVAGHPVHRLSDLKKCYDEVQFTYQDREGYGENQIVPARKINPAAEMLGDDLFDPDELNLSAEGGKKLERYLATGVVSNLDLFLGTYIEDMGGLNVRSMLFRQYVAMDAFVITRSFLNELGYANDDLQKVFPEHNLNPSQVMDSQEAVLSYLRMLLTDALELRDKASGSKYTAIVAKAKEFIQNNYSDSDISLNLVAEAVDLSPNHFSKVFSQETGMTFIEYLTSIRMEEAKRLLRTTQMKTTDIAFAVGYGDPHYFSSQFKKTQNCTPREYRSKE